MRGGILSALASAFRLGTRSCEDSGGMSTATAKRFFRDEPGVADEKRAAVVRALVASLFTREYLAKRGLAPEEVAIHNELVSSALEDILERWDDSVRVFNIAAEPPVGLEVLLLGTGFLDDALVRCAAYLNLYGRLHPVLDVLVEWSRQPGIRAAFDELRNRARFALSLDRLEKDTGLARNTLRALLRGKSDSPHAESIERLALAFHKYEVAGRRGEERASAAEIEFDLRVACAVARVCAEFQVYARRKVSWEIYHSLHRCFRSELRRYSREEVGSVLVQGTQSPLWASLGNARQRYLQERLWGAYNALALNERRSRLLLRVNPREALQRFAAESEVYAHDLQDAAASMPHRERKLFLQYTSLIKGSAVLARIAVEADLEAVDQLRADTFDPDSLAAGMMSLSAITPAIPRTEADREKILREAVTLCPSSTIARAHLASFLNERGHREEAIAHWYAIVGEDPDDLDARLEIALLLADSTPAEALAEIDEIHKRGGPSATSHYTEGLCHHRLGRRDDAETAYQRALALNKHHAPSLEALARCKRDAGDERAAREFERRAGFYGGCTVNRQSP
jgi:Flp pilus assembly protein TadD/transcriptional regulator with XRE-family HTH domain